MKQLTALTMACLLVLASCQKPEDLAPGKDISYTQADFMDNEALVPGAEKAGNRKSDMKIVIRKVNNMENTYRLVLKVDSVALNADAAALDPKFEPIYGLDVVVYAGLSMPDPTNPDLDQAIFTKGQLVFRKQNENGYFVYVSDPFATTVKFDYELVGIDYTLKVTSNGLPVDISDKSEYFILPGGKTVEQDPKLATIKAHNKPTGETKSIVLTFEDDPAQQIVKVVFVPDPISSPNDPKQLVQLPSFEFTKTHFNQNNGLARYSSEDRWGGTYGDGKTPGSWSGTGAIILMGTSGPIYGNEGIRVTNIRKSKSNNDDDDGEI